ncbi:uncharacterized protein LOC131676542 [Topomyia yanbarensis]|uniref:uncharacterized protein LOC131676542 n=1 Tax=Topomyia yanbarensis TaxID=2498891 RepID=UPI00273B6A98|nr:uncharacterized protein LOC131676542 [Topomyia yanbarensis]
MKRRCTQKKMLLQVIQQVDGKFLCKADEKCGYKQAPLIPGNFKRHIFKMHPAVYAAMNLPVPPNEKTEPAKKKSKKMCVDMNAETVLPGILQLATVDRLPYSFPDMVGFRTLLEPICKAAGITTNRKNIASLVENSACTARQLISAELKQQPLIAIEVDGASRGSRHFIGINACIVLEGKVIVRNLAIKETLERQTKEHLKSLIEDVLSDFGVTLSQVYSVTHDNGANMVASVSEMKKSLESSNIELSSLVDGYIEGANDERNDVADIDVEQTDEQIETGDVEETEDENDDFINGKDGGNDTVEASQVVDPFDVSMQQILDSVRCSAHTAQLAVLDVIKPYEKRIVKIQKLVIKLRQREYLKFVRQHDANLPPISNKIRWNSTYLMLKCLQKQKTFFNILRKSYPEIDFTSHWKFIDKFCEAFEAPFILTMQLQKRHVILSNFYAYWLVCQAKLMRCADNCLAKRLLKAFQRRLQKLTESLPFKACVYLDPRFNFLGSKRISPKDKELAQEFLVMLHNRVSGKKIGNDEKPGRSMEEEDELETLLAEFFDEDSEGNTSLASQSNSSVAQKLKALEIREKVPTVGYARPGSSNSLDNPDNFDLLSYWEGQKYTNPGVYKVAMIAFSASATQVSVERSFSALKLLLNDHRMNLTASAVENALLLKLNSDLLPQIAKMACEEDH